jgi:hypothetical protein
MTRKWIVTLAAAAGLSAGLGGAAAAAGGFSDEDQPITGADLDRACAAALAFTGGGRVTETEVGDEESYYEVEVTLPDGRQIDVQLDENFDVVGSSSDESPDDADGDEGGRD